MKRKMLRVILGVIVTILAVSTVLFVWSEKTKYVKIDLKN